MKSPWGKPTKRALRTGGLGLIILAAFAPMSARAQDDDDKNSIWNLDKRIFEGFAKGLGLQKGGDPSIDYRERSPLVVPPTRNLPPPETAAPRRAAEWPVDADIRRRDDAAARKKLDRRGYDDDYVNRTLLPSELGPPGAGPASNKPAAPGDEKDKNPEGTNLSPSGLGYFGGLFSGSAFGFGGPTEEVGTFTKEPPRTSLIEPPTGYQTPSAAQPYGISKSTPRQTVTPLDPAVGSLGR